MVDCIKSKVEKEMLVEMETFPDSDRRDYNGTIIDD
jgi:hypothetical protein